jgi:hypothetical protein
MGSGLLHVLLGSNRTVTELSADNGVGCALLDDGSVKCWGWNIRGSLGLGDTTDRGSDATQMGNALPAVDLAGGPVRHVSVSEGATCAVFMDGRLKCWGRNIGYLLGVGDALDRGDGPNEMGTALPFVPLGTAWKTSTVSPGFPACALSTDGRVKCWGLASGGQLGTGDGRDRIALADLGDALPALSFGGGIVTQLVASAGSAYALLADGSVWAWGDNATGTLGVGTTTNAATPVLVNLGANVRVAKIHTRRWTTCAVTTDGRVKCWGDNKYGQLGLGDQRTRGGAPSDMGDNLPFIDL